MATVLRIGPADHGRAMTFEEFQSGDYEEGYRYELIDGALYVAPAANAPEGVNESWIAHKLGGYMARHPEVINFIHTKARVFVPGRPGVTVPEPDVAAYHEFPRSEDTPVQWEDYEPILVVEVLSKDDPDKDLVRNVALYFEVPGIREYWVIDGRPDSKRPTMTVHRRYGKRWRIIEVAYQETYTTKLLPGFKLLLDPHRW